MVSSAAGAGLSRACRALLLLLLFPLLCPGAGCPERFIDFHVTRLFGLRVTRIDATGFEMQVRCEIENPNPIGATIDEVRFQLRLGEHPMGHGSLPGAFPIAARGRVVLEAPVRIGYTDLPADFPRQVEGGELRLRTIADLRARTRLGSYRMRLTSKGSTRIADSLAVLVQGPFQSAALKVEGITFGGLELRRLRLRLRLLARNLFAFPVRIRRGEFSLEINGQHFGETRLQEALELPARGSRRTEVEIAATHGTVASVFAGMLAGEPSFRVRGTLWIDPLGGVSRIPLDVKADSSVFEK